MAKYLNQEGVELLVQTFDNKLGVKADRSELADYATKKDLADIDVDVDLTNYATKSYVDSSIADVDLTGLATESYVTSAIADKASKSYVDGLIANIPAPYCTN